MAYAFQNIRNAMGGEDDQQQKQDIFAQPDPGQGGAALPQGAQPSPGSQTKTSTEGAEQLGGSGSGGQPAPQAANQQQQSARAALSKSTGKTQNPALISKAQQHLSDADRSLQESANSYVQNAKNTNYGVSAEDVDRYVKGDQSADKVGKLLGTGAVRADQFRPQQEVFNDIDQLQTDAGLMSALRQQGGESYNAGMAAFDLAALQRTPGFDQIRQQLAQQRDAYQKRADETAKTKSAEAQSLLEQNLAQAKGGLKGELEKRQAAMESDVKARTAAANSAAREQLARQPIIDAQSTRDELLAGLAPGLGLNSFVQGAQVDPSQYGSVREADWRDMIGQDEAMQFNRIMGALGRSDPEAQFVAGAGGPAVNFDREAYKKAILGQAEKSKGVSDVTNSSLAEAQRIADIAVKNKAKADAEKKAVETARKKAADEAIRKALDEAAKKKNKGLTEKEKKRDVKTVKTLPGGKVRNAAAGAINSAGKMLG